MLMYADEAMARQLSQEERDAEYAASWHAREQAQSGNPFTCFTSTKVQILTQSMQQLGMKGSRRPRGLRRSAERYAIYLLYWYKSANTDAAARAAEETERFVIHLLYY
jgi:hypothetical protein